MTTTTTPLVRPAFAKASTVVFLLLLPFVAHVVWDYVESRRLNNRIDAIKRSGAPTVPPRVYPLPPDADRASRYYRAAAILARFRRPGEAMTDDDREALALADRGAALPFLGFGAGNNFSYLAAGVYGVMHLSEERAKTLAEQGNGDGAFRSLFTAAQLIRTSDTTFVVPRLESVKYVVERAKPSADARALVVAAYAALDRPDAVRRGLENNRAARLEQLSIALMRNQSIDLWIRRPWIMHEAIRMLDGSTEQTEAFAHGLEKRAATIHCEHQLVAGEVVNCSP